MTRKIHKTLGQILLKVHSCTSTAYDLLTENKRITEFAENCLPSSLKFMMERNPLEKKSVRCMHFNTESMENAEMEKTYGIEIFQIENRRDVKIRANYTLSPCGIANVHITPSSLKNYI